MQIIPFNVQYAKDFQALNIDWLEKYFYVEPYDREVLGNPEKYIIEQGGYIFFVRLDDRIIGTVALMRMHKDVYELTKMAVHHEYQGQGIGHQLIKHVIAFAKAEHFEKLVLYSNTLLENAIYIYRKFGFKEIELETNANYKRSNIKMELLLNKSL